MSTSLNENDNKILAFAWQCFKAPPDIDFIKLSKLAGHTNPKSTANAFSNIRKKLAAIAEANGDSAPASPTKTKATPKKTPATSTKGKGAKTATAADGDDVEDGEDTNMKKTPIRNTPKRGGTKRKYVETGSDDDAIKEESGAENGEDDDTTAGEPKTPEPTVGVKVKSKKEGAGGKSPTKSPVKRKAGGAAANKKVKTEVETEDDDGVAEDGSKEYTDAQAVKDEVEEGGEDGGEPGEVVE